MCTAKDLSRQSRWAIGNGTGSLPGSHSQRAVGTGSPSDAIASWKSWAERGGHEPKLIERDATRRNALPFSRGKRPSSADGHGPNDRHPSATLLGTRYDPMRWCPWGAETDEVAMSVLQRTLKDPEFDKPYVDVDEWRDEPTRHRYVHGGFKDTDLRFSFYFPAAEQYEGRFFQPILAVSGTEHAFGSGTLTAMGGSIAMAIDSGAYMVESNLGRLTPYPGEDSTVTGFRASAAAAEYSRTVAAEMYGEHRPFGYCFGGSGGGFKTMSCMENTEAWDGGVPFIIGGPQSLPNVFSVQAHAMRILWDKFPMIVDATDPGGSGDMYGGRGARGARRGDRYGLPTPGVVRRAPHRRGLHRRVVHDRRQHDQVGSAVLRRLLERSRLPRRQPDRIAP